MGDFRFSKSVSMVTIVMGGFESPMDSSTLKSFLRIHWEPKKKKNQSKSSGHPKEVRMATYDLKVAQHNDAL